MADNSEPVKQESQAAQPAEPAQPATTPAAAQNTDQDAGEHMIPKSRFDEVNAQLKELRAAAEQAEQQRKKMADAAAAEQGKFEELWQTAVSEKDKIAAELAAVKLVQMQRDAATTAGLPAALASRLRGETIEDLTADARQLLESLPRQTAVPSTDGGAGRSANQGSGLTASEVREIAARLHVDPALLAEQYGITLKK